MGFLATGNVFKCSKFSITRCSFASFFFFLFGMSGDTLSWAEAKKVAAYIKEHGIMQFLAIYNARKNDGKEKLLWGDEIEYLVVKCDPEKKTIKLTLRE